MVIFNSIAWLFYLNASYLTWVVNLKIRLRNRLLNIWVNKIKNLLVRLSIIHLNIWVLIWKLILILNARGNNQIWHNIIEWNFKLWIFAKICHEFWIILNQSIYHFGFLIKLLLIISTEFKNFVINLIDTINEDLYVKIERIRQRVFEACHKLIDISYE